MSTYDTAYHPGGCSCGQPAGPMSPDEFLRHCFYPRLMARTEHREERNFGGIRSFVPQPKRKTFLPKEYRDTDIWDSEPRHPLLCLHGHYTWEEGDDKTPSSFTINAGGHTLSTLKHKIETGDNIFGAHFKHWTRELDECHCGNGRDAGDILIDEQRKAALANRTNGTPVLQDFDGTYELRFHIQNETSELTAGTHVAEHVDSPDALYSSDLQERVSLWLESRDVGSLPGNCAGFLCFENSTSDLNLFIPDEGKIILIIPFAKRQEYLTHLRELVETIPDGVKMKPGTADSLSTLENYRQGTIVWNDAASQEIVKSFLERITGLEMRKLRSTRPLMAEVYDETYEIETPVSSKRLSDFAMDSGKNFFIKIRRTRNAPLEGFRLLLGPGINASSLNLNGLEETHLGIDQFSGGTLWKIFIRNANLQNGLWAKLRIQSHDDGAWIEVFDHGSTVEQSGCRINIVSKEAI